MANLKRIMEKTVFLQNISVPKQKTKNRCFFQFFLKIVDFWSFWLIHDRWFWFISMLFCHLLSGFCYFSDFSTKCDFLSGFWKKTVFCDKNVKIYHHENLIFHHDVNSDIVMNMMINYYIRLNLIIICNRNACNEHP